MNRIPVSQNFFLDESFPKDMHDKGIDYCMGFIDPRIFKINQRIRELFGKPIEGNTYWKGGTIDERGVRHPNGTGALHSRHKYVLDANGNVIQKGSAHDLASAGMTGKDWRLFVVSHAKELYSMGVRRIEDPSLATTWLHYDLIPSASQNPNEIVVVDLSKITERISAK